MASIIPFPLLLVLQVWFVCSVGFARKNGGPPVVHIISGMPKSSEPFSIHCEVNGTDVAARTLTAGADYQWRAEVKDIYYCASIWGRYFAAWHAYEPARDPGHGAISTLVKRDGFFLRWNKRSWHKIDDWETD